MRHLLKKFLAVVTAASVTLSMLALAACGGGFRTPSGIPEGEVSSNGGFVVQKGEYVYFINGIDTYDKDNTYGEPVKASLMRIRESDLDAGNNTAEIVIPSLMVAGDYTSGIFIYGDRVYYATPNNVRNTSGVIENDYLDFKSAKLDGSDIKSHTRLADNTTVYRYVQAEEGGDVYLLYVSDSDLISINTATNTETTLASSVSAYTFHSTDKTDPYVYYTMSVGDDLDSDSPVTHAYNQIYRVRADATESPYTYTWDEDYLAEHDNEPPYLNLGTIVLDGIGSQEPTQFTHDLTDGVTPASPLGYTYTLQAYNNGGVYFTRTEVTSAGSTVGNGGDLYYLAAEKLASGWNSVSGNAVRTAANGQGALDVVANSTLTSKASTSAIFYLDPDGTHHYIYVNGSSIFRADVATDGTGDIANEQEICYDASSATLVALDDSDATYHYVYFTRSSGNGLSVERAVYNGSGRDYDHLPSSDDGNAEYRAVSVLDVQHASSWYNYEILDGKVFYADAESFSSTSYNYIACVDLAGMNNAQIKAFNEKYDEIMDSDDGLLAQLTDKNENDKLSNAIRYYFYTGETEQFYANIDEAVEAGKSETYLYSEEEKQAFADYAAGTGEYEGKYLDGEKSYRTLSYFVTRIGAMSEDDAESLELHWTDLLERYVVTETEEETLPDWAWALIGVAIGIVLVGAGLAVFLIVRKKKRGAQEKEAPARMRVDTTDDRSVDVYAMPEEEALPEVEAAEEGQETAQEAPAEDEEAPSEEAEAPAESGADEGDDA